MLKHEASAYESGRRHQSWWKWKLDPETVDAILLYAQPGHGRRANLYTDFTRGVGPGVPRTPAKAARDWTRPPLSASITGFGAIRRNASAPYEP